MRSGPNTRRLRGRNSGRRNQSSRSRNYESSGPESKVRGNAQQVVEKYLQLARDASTVGDPVKAENYYQHAEHYYRVQAASSSGNDNAQGTRSQDATPSGAQNGAGNGAGLKAQGNGAADGTDQPDVHDGNRPDGAQGANGAGKTDGPTRDAG